MATLEEVEILRRMVSEPGTATYSNDALSALLDSAGGLDAAAAVVWREKAAKAANLVNTSESGSSRSMQQVHQNALNMAKFYDGRVVEEVAGDSPPFTTAIERP